MTNLQVYYCQKTEVDLSLLQIVWIICFMPLISHYILKSCVYTTYLLMSELV